jgi:two-component system response regulator AtoC
METILIIDDDDSIRESLEIFLGELKYKTLSAKNGIEGVEILEKYHPDLVLTDLKMPGKDGLEVLNEVREFDSHIPVIVITAFDDMDSTIKAIQLNAYDYIEKPIETERLRVTIKRALESRKLSERLDVSISEDLSEYQLENRLIGKNKEMKEIYKKIGMVSSNKINILIQGESGTGKELITKIIHYSGLTKAHPFVAINCTALSESLLESELFGHVKGSFTGAIRDKKGKFELAGEGTIFLDEISEISPNLQVKLLRVIQEREFERVGGENSVPLNARIVAATNRNLSELVARGKFREDLYFRLNVFSIDIPPLKERKEDIPLLVVHFLNKINKQLHKMVRKIPYEVMEILENYEWVGNVRELENTLTQAVVLAKGDVLEKENILLRKSIASTAPVSATLPTMSLAEVEKKHIKLVLDHVKWDKTKAADILKISKPTLYNKIQVYNLSESL